MLNFFVDAVPGVIDIQQHIFTRIRSPASTGEFFIQDGVCSFYGYFTAIRHCMACIQRKI